MNKKLFFGLAALLTLSVLSVSCTKNADTVADPFTTDANKVATVAGTIADFTAPQGYAPEYAAQLAGYTLVAYNPGDGHSHLMLLQAPPEVSVDQDSLIRQLHEMEPQPRTHNRPPEMTVVGESQLTVRGQSVTFVIAEGVNSDNHTYRQMLGLFQGKGGLTLLAISEPVTRWDQTAVEAFISSIR
jgi:hypothetical protein